MSDTTEQTGQRAPWQAHLGNAIKRIRDKPEVVVLLVIVALLAAKKLWLSQHVLDFGADGGFYINIAQNVRDGLGLTTNVSVFHKGFESFPHPTSVYPLWPLLLGYVGRVVPLESAAIWLPTLLYFLTLGLAYRWGRQLSTVPLLRDVIPGFHAGHLAVVVIGFNFHFFTATSTPYTEGLGFVLLFAMLLRAERLLTRGGLLAGLEWGAWLAVLVLTRSQFVVILIAVLATLLWNVASGPRRGRHLVTLTVASAILIAVWVPYAAYRATFTIEPGLKAYIRFDLARANNILSAIPFVYPTQGFFNLIFDRLGSLGVAFGWNKSGYFGSFSLFAFAMPIAALVGGAFTWRRRRNWRQLIGWLRPPQRRLIILLALIAIGGFASLHTVHKVYHKDWHFGMRQGLSAVFMVYFALLFLLRGRGRVYFVALFLLVAGTYASYERLHNTARIASVRERLGIKRHTFRTDLVAWLKAERADHGELTVAIVRPEAQLLAWRTPGVNFHWLSDSTTKADIDTLFGKLGVRYLLVQEPLRNVIPHFVTDPEFERDYVELRRFTARHIPERMPATTIIYVQRPMTQPPREGEP